jgi:CRISPR/Cas system-associated exonuclease Cas4 (RecB family)
MLPDGVEIGTEIHGLLERYPECPEEIQEFSEALEKFLKDDEIIAAEKTLNYKIGKHSFVSKIDALTKKGYIIDYKITSAPSYYGRKVGYQLPMYRIANGEGQPVYLLFKVNPRNRREFITLIIQESHLSKDLLKRKKKYIARIVEMIEMCKEDGIFPPSYSDCNRCFYRHKCPYYGA